MEGNVLLSCPDAITPSLLQATDKINININYLVVLNPS